MCSAGRPGAHTGLDAATANTEFKTRKRKQSNTHTKNAKIPVTEADSESVGTTSTALVEERSGNAFMRNVIFGRGPLHNQSVILWLCDSTFQMHF